MKPSNLLLFVVTAALGQPAGGIREYSHVFVLDDAPGVESIEAAAHSSGSSFPLCLTGNHRITIPPPHGACRAAPPFEPAHGGRAERGLRSVYGWAAAADTKRGSELVQQWLQLANERRALDCTAEACGVIVRANFPATAEQRLVRCRTLVYEGRLAGVPWDCELDAVLVGGATYLRVIRGYEQSVQRTLGLPDFDLLVVGRARQSTAEFLEQVRRALAQPPLELDTRRPTATLLTGVSEYRPSRVLQRYRPRPRELATVRVDANLAGEGDGREIKLIISTNLLVNPLATTRPEDWRRPSEPQERDYIRAVLEAVRLGLIAACPAPVWRSDTLLTCGLPQDAALPRWAEY